MSAEDTKYFDLLTNGLGYLNAVQEVATKEGDQFLVARLSALRGNADQVHYTHFDCRVVGKQAQVVIRDLKAAVDRKAKVLIGFTLSDLHGEAFTFKQGDKTGELGVSLKARLLRISWAKVDGVQFAINQEDAA